MALGNTNITTAAVNTELGSPFTTPRTWTQLCMYPMNTGSFYGPWLMTTNAAKDPSIVYATTNRRLGDFRSYNHTATTPAGATNFTHNYIGTAATNIGITTHPNDLNVLACNSGATYITYNAYLTTANRTAQTSRFDQDINAAQFSAITPLTGHIRTQSSKINSTHVDTFVGMTTSTLTKPNDYIYLDTFFSDSGGNRLVNLGSVSGGYTTITMHQQQNPTLTGGANYTSPPTGYTAIWPAIHSSSTPRCTDGTLTQTPGGTTYSFYLSMAGVYGAGTRNQQVTSCTVSLKVGGVSATIKTGQALGYSSKTLIAGTIPAGLSGGNFSYDEVWTVEVSSITWGANYSAC